MGPALPPRAQQPHTHDVPGCLPVGPAGPAALEHAPRWVPHYTTGSHPQQPHGLLTPPPASTRRSGPPGPTGPPGTAPPPGGGSCRPRAAARAEPACQTPGGPAGEQGGASEDGPLLPGGRRGAGGRRDKTQGVHGRQGGRDTSAAAEAQPAEDPLPRVPQRRPPTSCAAPPAAHAASTPFTISRLGAAPASSTRASSCWLTSYQPWERHASCRAWGKVAGRAAGRQVCLIPLHGPPRQDAPQRVHRRSD